MAGAGELLPYIIIILQNVTSSHITLYTVFICRYWPFDTLFLLCTLGITWKIFLLLLILITITCTITITECYCYMPGISAEVLYITQKLVCENKCLMFTSFRLKSCLYLSSTQLSFITDPCMK